jgi:plasmid stability protein
MATLTIRNLPEDIRDQMRREAAERGRSMEEEARQALAERYRKRLSPQELSKILDRLHGKRTPRGHGNLLASESLVASRRIEALYDNGQISRKEKSLWDQRIAQDAVSLKDVETFVTETQRWPARKS